MKGPEIPIDESERLKELESYQLFGHAEEEDYDFITSMAAQICGTKISLISLITKNKQWLLSRHGLEARELQKEYSFCVHAIKNLKQPFIVEDARKDKRFKDNPLTVGDPHIIFYTGFPLVTYNGYPLGTLCVIDDTPKRLSKSQLEQLKKLAQQTVKLFENRKKSIELDFLNQELNKKNELLKETQEANQLGIWELDIASGKTIWSDIVYDIHEVPKDFDHNKANGLDFYHPDYRPIITDAITECISYSTPFDIVCQMVTANDRLIWVRSTGRKVGNKLIGSFQDISEIKHNEIRYKLVIEGTNVGTWEWNVQTGETVFNERWAETLGYTLEELAPVNIETLMKLAHPDDREKSLSRLNACFEKKAAYYEFESRMKHKEGHWVWVYDRGKVFEWTEDGKPLMMYGTQQVITESKNLLLNIEYQRNLFSALYNLSPIGLSLNEYETGKFLDVNDKLLEPTGYSKEEFLSLSYWDTTPKEYAALEATALQQMERKGSYDTFEKEYIRKDGSRYPIALQGVVIKDNNGKKLIWSFVRDISQEKEHERKLQNAISSLQAILEASKQVSIIATDKEGTITLFNSGAEQRLGYKAQEVVGKHNPGLIHLTEEVERESKELSQKYNKEIKGFETFIYEAKLGEPSTKEWTYIRKDGARFPVLLSINAIADKENIVGYLGLATDISELKKVEKEIKSLLDITNEQNERLRNFAHIVSHNLRSHSGGISGILKLIQVEHSDLMKSELFELLNKGAENLKQTVHDLTEIVKVNLTQFEFSKINIHEVIQKNTESLNFLIKKAQFEIINNIDKGLIVTGVPAYIDSIVLNMITNAIKYRSRERSSYLKIYAAREDSKIAIYFKDNGLGIDLKKHGEKMFGMYKTFHDHSDSRGVGLFITKNQIESMGGKINIESEVNEGTTFKVTLPK